MNFRENAISLADKLRSPEDLVNYLQKNRIFITSFNCLACDIVCERVNWKSGTNYFYFRCPNYLLERSIRQSVLFGEIFFKTMFGVDDSIARMELFFLTRR